MIPLFQPFLSDQAKLAVQDVLDSTYINTGHVTAKFEQALAQAFSIPRPLAVNSCTSALHLGLVTGGIQAGDEVIVSPQTFVASAFAIMMAGATPVFADIDALTGNITPDTIAAKITKRTKAIMAVHWAGLPCTMDDINAVANEHKLWVIEDAAHALGAMYKGTFIGSWSRFTAFSFQAIKQLTTADGGALVCADSEDAYLAHRLRWFGMDRDSKSLTELGERADVLTRLGFKYNMNDFTAALGLSNLDFIRRIQFHAQDVADEYRRSLEGLAGVIACQPEVTDRISSYWFFPVFVERPADLIRYMGENGIQVSGVHTRIDRHPVFGGERKDLHGQEWFTAHHIGLPTHMGVTSGVQERIVELFKKGW